MLPWRSHVTAPARVLGELSEPGFKASTSLVRATARWRSGKALGIGELLASACNASATLDRS